MQIYLPIAELSINIFLLLGLGGGVGILSGLFGVGGGFLLTPFLIFIGVPPAIAVATQANQIVASSVSGVLAHWSRDNVDFKLGVIITLGGFAGSTLGVIIFGWLHYFGQIDLVISALYIFCLTAIGIIMGLESGREIWARRSSKPSGKRHHHSWMHGLPLRMRFPKSGLYMSVLLPIAVGFGVGILSAIMGVGGAFMMVPAMIYLLGMPLSIAIGTSLLQVIFVAANVTFLQSANNHTVDGMLAFLLTIGSVTGAQIGSRLSYRIRGDHLRLALACLILLVAFLLLAQLIRPPADPYSIFTLSP